jgi:glycosyltransferase involved in cell wall biosynthesis
MADPKRMTVSPDDYLSMHRRADKKLLLIVSDSPCVPTGTSKAILRYFRSTWPHDDWDLVQYGWWHQMPLHQPPWPLIPTAREHKDTPEGKASILSLADKYGARTLLPVIQKLQPDLVYSLGDCWALEPLLAARAACDFRWVAQIVVDGAPIPRSDPHWQAVLTQADHILPVTDWGKVQIERFLAALGKDAGCVGDPVPHGTDLAFYCPDDEEREEVRKKTLGPVLERIGGSGKEPVIMLTVCRNQFRKGLQQLMEAFSAVRLGRYRVCGCGRVLVTTRTAPGTLCRMLSFCDECGASAANSIDGIPHPEFFWYMHVPFKDIRATSHDLNEMLDFVGLVRQDGVFDGVLTSSNRDASSGISEADLRKLYRASDFFCLTTMGEGFGVPFIEALGCGLPVVGSSCTSHAEILQGAARLVPSGSTVWEVGSSYPRPVVDVGSLAGELLRMVESAEYRSETVQAGMERAANYRAERVALRLKGALEEQMKLTGRLSWQVLSAAI